MSNICVYKAQIHWQCWIFSTGCRRRPSHQYTFNPLHRERFFSDIVPCFLSLCIFVYLYISWMLWICQVTRAQSGEKKTIWHCTVLHKRRGARGIYDAKSLKENENWIMETTAHFYTSHGLCMCGGESKTFVWVMGNYTDALSFICLSVCCCFRVWIFFSWTKTILT